MIDNNKVLMDLLEKEKPEIIIAEGISRGLYERVERSIFYLRSRGSPPVKIVINSGGGEVTHGLDIYDLIRLYEGETTGLVINQAASMAAVILQACDIRMCAPHAGILIHHVSRQNISLDSLTNSKKLNQIIDDMKKSQNRLYRILTSRTGKTIAQIACECRKEIHRTAEEALAFGLIDKIWE